MPAQSKWSTGNITSANFIQNPHHLGHALYSLLPAGRRYRGHKNSKLQAQEQLPSSNHHFLEPPWANLITTTAQHQTTMNFALLWSLYTLWFCTTRSSLHRVTDYLWNFFFSVVAVAASNVPIKLQYVRISLFWFTWQVITIDSDHNQPTSGSHKHPTLPNKGTCVRVLMRFSS